MVSGSFTTYNQSMRLFRRIQNTILSSPTFLGLKVSIGHDSFNKIVSKGLTDICIEGFPRSGNSYATSMFLLANPESRIAHHTHNLGNIKRSVRLNLPTLILIRNPIDAITSLCLYHQGDYANSIKRFFEEYVFFYSGVKKIKKELVVVADFSDVISNFNLVIKQLNISSGNKFNLLEDVPVAESMVKKDYSEKFRSETLPSTQFPFPTDEKKKMKAVIEPLVQAEGMYSRAIELYQHFKEIDY